MGALRALSEADRSEAVSFLDHPDGLNIYLVSQLDDGVGDAFVWSSSGQVEGVAWFGPGRNLVLAGNAPGFGAEVAQVAKERERSWVMVVGPYASTSEFLEEFQRGTRRRPRLDRAQTFCVQRREALPAERLPGLVPAVPDDIAELAAAAARMSAEDFEIDPFRIDRDAVRRTMAEKIRGGRSWLCREEGRVVFKVDLAVRHPAGGQVEGVFTVEDRRGHGLATRGISELGHRLLDELPCLTLHVNSRNRPALRAYEKAGYVHAAELRLAIFPPIW